MHFQQTFQSLPLRKCKPHKPRADTAVGAPSQTPRADTAVGAPSQTPRAYTAERTSQTPRAFDETLCTGLEFVYVILHLVAHTAAACKGFISSKL